MRWRLIVLGVLGIAMAMTAIVCLVQSGLLTIVGQDIYTTAGSTQLTPEQMTRASESFQVSAALQLLVPPLLTGAVFCLLAMLVVFARRWQLRAPAPRTRRQAPSR